MFDLCIDCDLSEQDLTAALSQVFAVAPTEIWIIRDWSALAPAGPLNRYIKRRLRKHVRLVCSRYPQRGEFMTLLTIGLLDPRLVRLFPRTRESEVARSLCELLGCTCLVNTRGLASSRWLLVHDRRRMHAVIEGFSEDADGEEYAYIHSYDGSFLLDQVFTEEELDRPLRALMSSARDPIDGDRLPIIRPLQIIAYQTSPRPRLHRLAVTMAGKVSLRGLEM